MPPPKSQKCEPLWKKADRKANKSGLHKTVYGVNGDQYTGQYAENLKDGKGTYVWKANGAVYDGDWKDNKRCGYGDYSIPVSGVGLKKKYAGGWKDDQRHGYGTHYFFDNEYYEGEWFEDERSGWGRMLYQDGSRYEGEWFNDMRNGHGMLRFPNDNRYEGNWKDDMKHGDGKFFYLDKGQIYEGFWVNDIPKCGELRDYCREEASDPTEFPLPTLQPWTLASKNHYNFYTDIVTLIMSRLGLKYKIVHYEIDNSDSYGRPSDAGDGSWTNLVGGLMDGEIDIACSDISVTVPRSQVIDFAYPVIEDDIVGVTKAIKSSVNFWNFTAPYTTMLWAVVLSAFFASALTDYFCAWIRDCLEPDVEEDDDDDTSSESSVLRFHDNKIASMGQKLWFFYSAMMEQADAPLHAKRTYVSGRIVKGCWYFFNIVMISTYTANMAAFLTKSSAELPLNNIEELTAATHLEIGTVKGNFIEDMFRENNAKMMLAVKDRFDRGPRAADEHGVGPLLRKGGYVHVINYLHLYDYLVDNCGTYIVPGKFMGGKTALAVAKNSQLLTLVNHALVPLLSNSAKLDELKKFWFPPPFNPECESGNKPETTPEQMAGVFMILACGLTLGVLVTFTDYFLVCINEFMFRRKHPPQPSKSQSQEDKQSKIEKKYNTGISKDGEKAKGVAGEKVSRRRKAKMAWQADPQSAIEKEFEQKEAVKTAKAPVAKGLNPYAQYILNQSVSDANKKVANDPAFLLSTKKHKGGVFAH